MKIDIHISDATPEEAAMVFTGLTIAEATGRAAKAVAEKHARKELEKAVPESSEDLLLGACATCDNGRDGKKFDTDTCMKCSPAPKPAKEKKTRANGPVKAGNHKGNKYGIPTELSKTNLKEYQRLWALCKAHDITYEQAKAWKRRPTRTPGNTVKPSAQAIASSNDMKEPLPTIPASAIVIGAHVQQTRPDAGRQILGTGVVVSRRGEIVDVRDGAGKVHKIIAACLEAVTGPASDRATGDAS